MDNIVVKVSDLLNMAKSLSKDGMLYVKNSLIEGNDEFPASANFEAIDSLDDLLSSIDYEDIESVDIDI
ncbi:MAG: hypothetical protein SOZ48_00910 [Eubacterium sp.]|nr:hypothetical protein [Eubacterium sp.]